MENKDKSTANDKNKYPSLDEVVDALIKANKENQSRKNNSSKN